MFLCVRFPRPGFGPRVPLDRLPGRRRATCSPSRRERTAGRPRCSGSPLGRPSRRTGGEQDRGSGLRSRAKPRRLPGEGEPDGRVQQRRSGPGPTRSSGPRRILKSIRPAQGPPPPPHRQDAGAIPTNSRARRAHSSGSSHHGRWPVPTTSRRASGIRSVALRPASTKPKGSSLPQMKSVGCMIPGTRAGDRQRPDFHLEEIHPVAHPPPGRSSVMHRKSPSVARSGIQPSASQ